MTTDIICHAGIGSKKERLPHGNWAIIQGYLIVGIISSTIISPSMYQFITTPRELPDELLTEVSKVPFLQFNIVTQLIEVPFVIEF